MKVLPVGGFLQTPRKGKGRLRVTSRETETTVRVRSPVVKLKNRVFREVNCLQLETGSLSLVT